MIKYSRFTELKRLKQKRDLLNMKLTIYLLASEEEEIKYIRKEIKRLTIIIGDDYKDTYEELKYQIYIQMIDLLNKKITKRNAFEQAMKIEEYLINQTSLDYKDDLKYLVDELIRRYENIGYSPENIEKDFSTIKNEPVEDNINDYIKEALFEIKEKEEERTILLALREEIYRKKNQEMVLKISK